VIEVLTANIDARAKETDRHLGGIITAKIGHQEISVYAKNC
jgi:hypothetical protein